MLESQIERYPTTSVIRAITIRIVFDQPAVASHNKYAGADELAIAESLGQGVPLDLEHVRSGHGLRHNGRRTRRLRRRRA